MKPGHRLPLYWRHTWAYESGSWFDHCACGSWRQHQHVLEPVDHALEAAGPADASADLFRCACGRTKVVEHEMWS